MTLAGLAVSMAVASVTLVVSVQLYMATSRAIERQQVAAARLGDESDLLSLLRRDIRAASTIARGSTDSRLVLVGLDGRNVVYQVSGQSVTRDGPPEGAAWTLGQVSLGPRFEYPTVAGQRGRLVRVLWGPEDSRRSVILHLRNHGT